MIALSTPLSDIPHARRFLPKLKRLGIETVHDLIWHLPRRYDDFSEIVAVHNLTPGQESTIRGKIQTINTRRAWKRKLTITEALIADDSGTISAVWFNQPYLANSLTPDRMVRISGKVTERNGKLLFSNPLYELLGTGREGKHTGRIIPIYAETRGLTSRGIRFIIQPILKELEPVEDIIPESARTAESLPEINEAIQHIHFPDSHEEAEQAQKRFALEELFLLHLHNMLERKKRTQHESFVIPQHTEYIKQQLSALPFQLTTSQKQALWEITKDMEQPYPMNRLLQGDVGSGKTVVAAVAALLAAHANLQTAFMAPTELLARQHFNTFIKLFPNIEHGIALVTSNEARLSYGTDLETTISKKDLIQRIADGKVAIAIGTHALIQKQVTFETLGLVIIDEQHRFGVQQRAALTHGIRIPHLLSMSATPIPRTLSLTLFGDLDLSLITELPSERKRIVTKVVAPNKREAAYEFLRKEVAHGRQVFVVCPRITPPNTESLVLSTTEQQTLDIKSVETEYEKLTNHIFPEHRVGMLHGKLPARGTHSKLAIMQSFADGDIDILVSTSVVEVGIDVPNATIMMVEGAERFGLAQLYQFRGRVGRGSHQSYCFLFTDSTAPDTQKRLQAVAEATNGLELAEADLKLRGPGQFLGTQQTGTPDVAMHALQHPELAHVAQRAAQHTVQTHPDIKEMPPLAKRLALFERTLHKE